MKKPYHFLLEENSTQLQQWNYCSFGPFYSVILKI
jgi:hypothetical protein